MLATGVWIHKVLDIMLSVCRPLVASLDRVKFEIVFLGLACCFVRTTLSKHDSQETY